jgi:hypothetical protein
MENEFQIYSIGVCAALLLILFLYWLSLWVVLLTHYKHKNHPLILSRFGFLLNHTKDPELGEKPTLATQIYLPLLVTKRLGAAFIIAILCKYTLSPILILGFF